MKLTSACVYALRALVYLARNRGDGFITVDVIAGAEGLSETFLRKALTALAKARVLLASRGRHGGFCLARPARRITLLEVVDAIEGPFRGEAPRVGGGEHTWFDAKLQTECEGVAESVRRRLGKVRLADLARAGE
jgi:Rrf2 family protein